MTADFFSAAAMQAARLRLRLPACAVIFATAGAAVYPVTGEILLPMVAALALCLLALFDLLGMFDGLREGGLRRE